MSDAEDAEIAFKKRRLQGACDECKRRKIKCDSSSKSGNVCSSCRALRINCTHVSAMTKKKRGPPKGTPRGQRTIQSIVKSLLSTGKSYQLPNDPEAVKKLLVDFAMYIRELEEEVERFKKSPGDVFLTHPSTSSPSSTLILEPPPGSYMYADTHAIESLTSQLKDMGLQGERVNDRHFGQSSNLACLAFKEIKKEETPGKGVSSSHDFQRPEFWAIQPWQIPPDDPSNRIPFEFPEDDLLQDLAKLYFERMNSLLPALHAPSFFKSIAEEEHLKNRDFGALVLAVCAVGSKFSADPRVLENGTASQHSAGWKFIRQVTPFKKSFITPPSIYEVQLAYLYVLFMQSTTTPEYCWVLISIGVRLVQDVGAHRAQNTPPTLQGMLWRRVFWVFYVLDIAGSALLGRPRCMNTEDFDVDFPLEVDDEYWETEDPELAFKQPPEKKPSSASYWVCFIKLIDILGYAMRTIYAARPPKQGMSTMEWNERTVAELDSLLNKWVDEIPEHLKWDPNSENTENFRHSVMLYTTYYWVQILVHRTFIARPGENSVLSFPSLAICCNAARSCFHVIDVQEKKGSKLLFMATLMVAMFNSAVVLLVNVWRGRRLNALHHDKELADVQKFVDMLRHYEGRWEMAGRFYDILTQVTSVSRLHHQNAVASNLKRTREDTDRDADTPTSELSSGSSPSTNRPIAGSGRVYASVETNVQTTNTFSLPTHSTELGSLPIYQSFDWSTEQWPFASSSSQNHFELHTPMVSDARVPSADLTSTSSTLVPSSTDLFTNLSLRPSEVDQGSPEVSGVALDSMMMPSPGLFKDIHPDPSLNNIWDDWGSYMASVDEILQSVDSRM